MGVLDGLGPVVGGLITTFGQTVQLGTYRDAYNAATGKNERVERKRPVKALVEDYPARDTVGGAHDDGGGVLRGDKKVTVSATEFTRLKLGGPDLTMRLQIGGAWWKLVKIDTQTGTATALLYVLQVRR